MLIWGCARYHSVPGYRMLYSILWKTHLLSSNHTLQYTNMDKKVLIILIVSLVLVTGLALYIFTREKPQPAEQAQPLVLPPIQKEQAGFGGQVYEQVQSPAEKLPETNPFEAQTNPFEEVKTNPFEEGYKNPFE